jgi:hypothetical protein
MSRNADVPKMTKEFVASEILEAIRKEKHDPPIGNEARGILEGLEKDPLGMEEMLARTRAPELNALDKWFYGGDKSLVIYHLTFLIWSFAVLGLGL